MKTNEDGSVDIPLKKPLDLAGVKVSSLRMREPDVGDQLAAQQSAKTQEEQELALIANLCGVAPTDLHKLKLRDYKAVQAAFVGFLD